MNKPMAENFLIREGRPDELDEIVALVQTAYREFKEYFPAEQWEAWMENIREIVHAGAGVLIVAEEQGRIRAVKFYPFANQARMGHWPRPAAAMRILAVHPDSRGQGYGTLLTRECISRARPLKIHRMFLSTPAPSWRRPATFTRAWALKGPLEHRDRAPSPTASTCSPSPCVTDYAATPF